MTYERWLERRDEIVALLLEGQGFPGEDDDERRSRIEMATCSATNLLEPCPEHAGVELVTMGLLESIQSPRGGYTREALASIGVAWPPRRGWIDDVLNKPRVRIPVCKTPKPVNPAKKGHGLRCSQARWEKQLEKERVRFSKRSFSRSTPRHP